MVFMVFFIFIFLLLFRLVRLSLDTFQSKNLFFVPLVVRVNVFTVEQYSVPGRVDF